MGQTVLLAGVNDEVETLEALMRALVRCRVKPYYLHHPDLVRGTGHFRVSVERGQALMKALRGRLSGLAQPTYVLDVPGGHGKVPIGPGYLGDDPDALAGRADRGRLRRTAPLSAVMPSLRMASPIGPGSSTANSTATAPAFSKVSVTGRVDPLAQRLPSRPAAIGGSRAASERRVAAGWMTRPLAIGRMSMSEPTTLMPWISMRSASGLLAATSRSSSGPLFTIDRKAPAEVLGRRCEEDRAHGL